ncbi:UNVERIFIED_ORG: hypothetical protein LHK14_10500 [Roseateles sp. XES5]|nr:hypothetical protein [Roseateles sp. XES5]
MNAFKAKQQAKGSIDLLPPEPKAPAQKHARPFPARLETVDADFVVIRSGTARTSNDNRRPAGSARARPLSQHPLFRLAAACARLFERGLQCLPGRAFAGLVAGAFLFVFAYAGGLSALREAFAADTSRDVLQVSDVTAALSDRNGMKVLSVYGKVDNRGGDTQALPPLEIRVEGTGAMFQRRVALDAVTLAPGGSEHFALHIPHGGGKVPKVSVSFVREGARAN